MNYREQVIAFVDAFNVDDLDQVMSFFADDAEYITYDGRHCRGKAEIRAAFAAQFAGRFGRLRFIRDKVIVDEGTQQAAVSWRCEHGLAVGSPAVFLRWLQRSLAVLAGEKPYWEGVDLFRFRAGKLVGKHTFAQTHLPLFHRGN
ncbi:MAG: YybH family protein [Gammaproteobacteria bacterium]